MNQKKLMIKRLRSYDNDRLNFGVHKNLFNTIC